MNPKPVRVTRPQAKRLEHNLSTPRHSILRSTMEPGKPNKYTAQCGFTSTDEARFTIAGKVTCDKCLARINGAK